MKKHLTLICLMVFFSAAHAQDVIAELKKLTLENDSLKKELDTARARSTQKEKACNDSIGRLINANKSASTDLNRKLEKLHNDTADLHRQIKKLDKNNINNLETELKQKSDSITVFTNQIKSKDSLIASIKADGAKKENEKLEEGRQNAYNQIRQIYQGNTFDYLIKHTTKESVERDLQLVGNKDEAGKKLQDLQTFFAAQHTLEEKYNEQNVKTAQTQLNATTQQSEALEELKKRLSNYKFCCEGLQRTIGKINELDKQFTANDENIQKSKLKDIMAELSSYFRNYYFNLTDYPYLSDIVLQIMKVKQKDANANIAGLLSKL